MSKTQTDNILKKMVLSYELHKNQTYVERLLKEGEINGYKKILHTYESSDDQESLKEIYTILNTRIRKAQEELVILKAQEEILNKMNSDLENNLISLDINSLLEKTKTKYSPDVQKRINKGLCGLKRPGKGGFVCENEVIQGSKYCKEHLKKYDKIRYTDLIDENDDE